RAIHSLDRLFAEGRRWHDLIELLIRQLDGAAGAAWISLKLRLGGIYEGELEDKPSSIDIYEEVLQRSPDEPEAIRALERLIIDHDHTFRIAQILEPIYQRQDPWQKLVAAYDAELQARVWARLAEVREQQLGDAEGAIQSWRKVTAAADDHVEAWKALERLLGAAGRTEELVAVLEKRGTLSSDIAEQKQLAY